jgi:DNA-binding transcriptional regulator YdaS (Cro superfamily)
MADNSVPEKQARSRERRQVKLAKLLFLAPPPVDQSTSGQQGQQSQQAVSHTEASAEQILKEKKRMELVKWCEIRDIPLVSCGEYSRCLTLNH